jgi:hypothetical protein
LYLYSKSKDLLQDDADDDTASTLSLTSASSDEDSSDEDHDDDLDYCAYGSFSLFSSTSAAKKRVHFAAPLVTEIRTRPMTTRADKYYLHYNEHDYIDFKIEYLTGRERTKRVSFSRDVVSDVRTTPIVSKHTAKALFYTESELQG